MVNAALNWASIVGIVLAVGGAVLYFVRNFKPALARDYDVFFAAVGLLCGGILFFQGWRLDPILQFGQFLLAGSTVFFAYESVRLRGVTTEQARRSSYFDEDEPAPFRPRGGLGGSPDWDRDRERLDQPEPIRRRIRSREEQEDDFYRPRRPSRAAIPERAASRRGDSDDWDRPRRDRPPEEAERGPIGRGGDWDGPGNGERPPLGSRYSAGGSRSTAAPFGSRRQERDSAPEVRRGSRPVPTAESSPRSSRRPTEATGSIGHQAYGGETPAEPGVPQGSPIRREARPTGDVSDADFAPLETSGNRPRSGQAQAPGESPAPTGRPNGGPVRDNSSRFDD